MLLALLGGTSSTSTGSDAAGGAFIVLFIVLYVVIFVVAIALTILQVVGMWKIFEKSGQQGWLALIPYLNVYVLIRIVGREGWWIILYFIPCVNVVIGVIIALDLARVFGKSEGYGIGLAFLPFVFYPMLGFGDARYVGPQVGRVIS